MKGRYYRMRAVDYQKLLLKYRKNASEMTALANTVNNLETEYAVLTDQYMNGNIIFDIGKQQARLKREADKCKRKYMKLSEENRKIYPQLQKAGINWI